MRIISGIPIIIIGETGIGKTALIDLLSAIMNVNFKKLEVHAGLK